MFNLIFNLNNYYYKMGSMGSCCGKREVVLTHNISITANSDNLLGFSKQYSKHGSVQLEGMLQQFC